MIYVIYGLFKTVKMTFNTCEKNGVQRLTMQKIICRTGNTTLHFSLLFPACFYYNLIAERCNTLPLLFGALSWVSNDQSLNAFQGLSKAWDNSLHLLRSLFVFTYSIALPAFTRETNVPTGAQTLKTHLSRTATRI